MLLSFGRDPEEGDVQFDADSFMDTVGNLLGTSTHSISSKMLSRTIEIVALSICTSLANMELS